MKIEIDIQSADLALVTIDGRPLRIAQDPTGFVASLENFGEGVVHDTLGWKLACAICKQVAVAMEYAAEFDAWTLLPDQLVAEIEERMRDGQ